MMYAVVYDELKRWKGRPPDEFQLNTTTSNLTTDSGSYKSW